MIKNSKYFVVFTGAGISTSAGIPDYRSTADTVLETGPGQWEDKDTKGLSFEEFIKRPSGYKRVWTIDAIPTLSHKALKHLMVIN